VTYPTTWLELMTGVPTSPATVVPEERPAIGHNGGTVGGALVARARGDTYIRSGAAIPRRFSPSRRVPAASRHSANRFARRPSVVESTGQFS
jgi:hypothetical protein